MTPVLVAVLVRNSQLDTLLLYFEELHSVSPAACQSILLDRLAKEGFANVTNTNSKNDNNSEFTVVTSTSKVFTYGTLLERVLTFRKLRYQQKAGVD